MTDSVNMSLDDIIKKNRASRSRGRGGGGGMRGRGGGRGRGRGGGGEDQNIRSRSRGPQNRSRSRSRGPQARSRSRGPNNRGRSQSRGPQNRGRSQSRGPQNRGRSQSRGPQNRGRSQSRGPQNRGRSQSRGPQNRGQSRARSRSRQRSMSRSRSQLRRALTPRGRAGLEEESVMPPLIKNRLGNRGGFKQNGAARGSIHNRLGLNSHRGATRGISKRGRGIGRNNLSAVGLRSDQILIEQRNRQNQIRSQTFTRSRNNSFNNDSQLTVSVANDFRRQRRNSVGNTGYLSKQSLAQLNREFGGFNKRRGPGSVQSGQSNRSMRSNASNRSRGRGGNRGVARKFKKPVLNAKLQLEIASIQGRPHGAVSEAPSGVNFVPTPTTTRQTLNERFASII